MISITELNLRVKDKFLTPVILNNPELFETCLSIAQSEVISYLRPRYEVGAIITQETQDRNELLVAKMIDLIVYHLYSSLADVVCPDKIAERYEYAIDFLKSVRDGKNDIGLPLKIKKETGKPVTETKWHSQKKQNNNF